VEDVLTSKHPETRKPGEEGFHQYDNLTELPNLDLNKKSVEKVARRLSGCAGLIGGVNSTFLINWNFWTTISNPTGSSRRRTDCATYNQEPFDIS
jgi:hypothetical protein